MSDENELDPVEIEIAADDASKEAAPVEQEKPQEDPSAALDELKAQIEAHKQAVAREKAAREEAERRALENERYAAAAQAQAEDGRLTAISNAIRAVSNEADTAERAYSDAMAAGDYNLAAKAQREMAKIEARLLQLENGKAALEERLQDQSQRYQRQQEQVPQKRQNADPVEEWAQSLSAPAADWVRSHRKEVSDPAMLRKIGAAHTSAVDLEGLQADTPEYFAYIEERIGLRKAEPKEDAQPRDDSGRFAPRKSVPSAPVANSAPASRTSRGDTMILSAQMREVAHSMYSDLSPAEAERKYAQDRAAMIKAGRLGA